MSLGVDTPPSRRTLIRRNCVQTLASIPYLHGVTPEAPDERDEQGLLSMPQPHGWCFATSEKIVKDTITGLAEFALDVTAEVTVKGSQEDAEVILAAMQSAFMVDPHRGTDPELNVPYAKDTRETGASILPHVQPGFHIVTLTLQVNYHRARHDPASVMPKAA